jgi:amidase/aspartyl-tRNA(Asn)/glutamyl-tRNA(Gln) amidotransferase subunit A
MLEARQRNWQLFRKALRGVDVLLSPTSQIVARRVEDWDRAWTRDGARYAHGTFAPTYTSHTHMFNWLGFPAASVPCGFVDGLPVGLQIVGLPGREGTILRVANAFQKAYPRDERPPVS